jgi:hypothetical protein
MANEEIGLAEMISTVREELIRALEKGRSDPVLRFEYTAVELDVEIAVTKARQGKAGLNVWVVSAEGQEARTNTHTHHVKVSLTPLTPEGLTVSQSIAAGRVVGIDVGKIG